MSGHFVIPYHDFISCHDLMSKHDVSYHITSSYVISCHHALSSLAKSYHVLPCHITSLQVKSRYDSLISSYNLMSHGHLMPRHARLVTFHHVISHHIMSRHVLSSHVNCHDLTHKMKTTHDMTQQHEVTTWHDDIDIGKMTWQCGTTMEWYDIWHKIM